MPRKFEKARKDIVARVCKDVRILVNAHKKYGLDIETTKVAIQHVLRLWTMTGLRFRYLATPHWSEKAWERFVSNRKKNPKTPYKELSLDHVIPVNLFVNELVGSSPRFLGKNLKSTLTKYLISAVLTNEEAARLDKSYRETMTEELARRRITELEGDQIWARYREINSPHTHKSLFDSIGTFNPQTKEFSKSSEKQSPREM